MSPKTRTLCIKNGIVVTLGENNKVLYGHAVLCRGDRIERIAPQKTLQGKYDRVIDATGQVVLPGFINSHMHFYSTLVRGLGKAAPAKDFPEVLKHLWWRLDKKLTLEDCYYSALVALIDAVKHGTTTLIDHHASPGTVRGSLDAIARAVKQVGLRSSLCYELSDRDGPQVAREGIEENVSFIQRCQKEQDDQLRALFGLHASFTISDKTLEKAAEAGSSLGTGFHVHTAEAESDQRYNQKHFKMRAVERFHKFGILGPRSIAVHCVHVNDYEMDLLAETGTAVAHNPQSNMNNAVGVADIIKMTRKGVLVGLGTDAMTTNMLEEVRAALWAQHLLHRNPSVGFLEALTTMSRNNAIIANRYWDGRLGSLKEGNYADIVLVDYHPPTPFDKNTFLGHLCFGLSQSAVNTAIASGKVLMENKRLQLNLDESEIAARARELAKKLWARF